jgi:hypothetical protein
VKQVAPLFFLFIFFLSLSVCLRKERKQQQFLLNVYFLKKKKKKIVFGVRVRTGRAVSEVKKEDCLFKIFLLLLLLLLLLLFCVKSYHRRGERENIS